MKANHINDPNVTSTERALLRELDVLDGLHFKAVLKTIRTFIRLGYTYADARLSTRYSISYINRQIEKEPKASRKHLQAQYMLLQSENIESIKAMYERYLEADIAKKATEKEASKANQKTESKRKLRAIQLDRFRNGETLEVRYCAFGSIPFHTLEPEETPLTRHIKYVDTCRNVEIISKRNQEQLEIRSALVESSKRLTSRLSLPDSELLDHEAPLKELSRRYIPGGLAREFASHARLSAYQPPLEIIKTFPGNMYKEPEQPQPEQPETPPAAIATEVVEYFTLATQTITVAVSLPQKNEGNTTTVISRPDQAEFAAAVRQNCFDRCVITGARSRYRNEAAHLVEHHRGGIDHFTNGLILRRDIHELFDNDLLTINPRTLVVHIATWVMADDPDLEQYHGQPIAATHQPINSEYLVKRWEAFQRLVGNDEQTA